MNRRLQGGKGGEERKRKRGRDTNGGDIILIVCFPLGS